MFLVFSFWKLANGIWKLPIFPLKIETNVYTFVYLFRELLCYAGLMTDFLDALGGSSVCTICTRRTCAVAE